MLVLLFIVLLTPLLLLQSVSMSFLDESYIEDKIIPLSYTPVTDLLIEQASKTPGDNIIFKRRLSAVLTEDIYVKLLKTFSQSVFKATNFEFDFTSLKSEIIKTAQDVMEKLPDCLPSEGMDSFRFCKPYGIKEDPNTIAAFNNNLNKSLPDKFSLKDIKDQNVITAINTIVMFKKFLPLIIAFVSAVIVLLISALIYPPVFSAIEWVGASFIALTAVVIVFILIFSRLLDLMLLPDVSEFTSVQEKIIVFLLNHPVEKLKLIAYVTGITGVITFASGIILKLRK